ncbi:hypothetical protein GA0070607_2434 [Micromonospora coriariae]|uniref:Peptide zinc metalloprotease protein n=1 Tax=Micromonospora coriariae TaxID=285665 RepID=A0A1C4VP16_9ACTN|nr:hypothetical protein [Micromonospora coriariae]SCE85764.1 hypothetical protein GA0070607_2434 [Micromonospora coriariae]
MTTPPADPVAAAVQVDARSVVRFHPLRTRPSDDDPDEVVVGRPEVGVFIELPDIGLEAIDALNTGMPVGAAEDLLADRHGVRIDLSELVEDLVGEGFVAEVDGRPVPDPHDPVANHLPWLRPRHVRWLFGVPAKLAYAILVAATVVTVIADPDRIPSFRDFYWTDYVGMAVLVNTVMFSVAATAHEISHLVAARSLGAPARIGFGTRLHHLVLQTDVTAIWTVARRSRYRVYLSGILLDIAVVCSAILLMAYAHLPALVDGLLGALAVVMIGSMSGQFRVYMRTDLYFVLLDVLRCRNLFQDGLAYARHLLRRAGHVVAPGRIATSPDPTDELPARERKAVRIYAAAVVVGSTVALGAFAVYGLPVLLFGAVTAGSAIGNGLTGGNLLSALDATAIILVEGSLQVLFLRTFMRKHRDRWGRARRTR